MKNKILILGASSFIGYSLLKNKNWMGTISQPFKNYKTLIKKNRINKIKKKLIYFNYKKKSTFKNISDFNVIVNCIGFTKNFQNNNFNLKKEKKNISEYIKILKHLIYLNNVHLIIHIGSSAEYGYSKQMLFETSKCNPDTKYGKYKYFEFEKLKKIIPKKTKLVNVRCFSIFGENNKKNSLIELIKKKKKIIIKNSNQKINLINIKYLDKLISKIISFQKKIKKIEIFNFASTKSKSIKDIILKLNLRKNIQFQRGVNKNIAVSNKKLRSFINYSETQNFKILKNYLN